MTVEIQSYYIACAFVVALGLLGWGMKKNFFGLIGVMVGMGVVKVVYDANGFIQPVGVNTAGAVVYDTISLLPDLYVMGFIILIDAMLVFYGRKHLR